jgi:CBS domain-containing protein
MNLGELCNRKPVLAYRETSLGDAARLMREHHVGSLVIVIERLGERFPVGILTDRDIVIATVAKDLDPRGLVCGDVMSADLITLREEATVADALALMRERGVRRMPVLNERGSLAGIITLDDLLRLVGAELNEFARVIDWQRRREAALRG